MWGKIRSCLNLFSETTVWIEIFVSILCLQKWSNPKLKSSEYQQIENNYVNENVKVTDTETLNICMKSEIVWMFLTTLRHWNQSYKFFTLKSKPSIKFW